MPMTRFEEFFIRLLDHFGVQVEELGSRSLPAPARPSAHRRLPRAAGGRACP